MAEADANAGRVAVALSGGVDSAVAALLLARAGREVIGFFLRNGVSGGGEGARRSCCSASDANDARLAAARIGIPFYALDVAEPFARIIDGFVAAYRAGETPNPCVRCNVEVKFGRLLEVADSIGAAAVATGHYARVRVDGGRTVLQKAADSAKDQSYVLSTLRQDQLARAIFPLGGLRKDEVRRIAREAGLAVADKAESQEICFVPSGDYRDLVAERAQDGEQPGEIVTVEGEVVARHAGISGFTVGQRRGLGLARGVPQHVVRIEPETRRVVIGARGDACAAGFTVDDANWISLSEPDPGATFEVVARIRHRHRGARALVRALGGRRIEVRFASPEFAVTRGQTAALYVGDDLLAAGPIAAVQDEEDSCARTSPDSH